VELGQFEDSIVVPLEIKTGKEQVSHSAQVMLYTLLMSDYYGTILTFFSLLHTISGVPIKTGLLYYTKDDTVKGVPPEEHQLRSLLLRRNELAYYHHNEQKLPEPLKKAYETCKNCDQQDHCMVYWKAMEGGKKEFFEDKNMETMFEKNTRHLTATHIEYFNMWDRLIDLEKRDALLQRKEIWSLTSEEREKIGR
jgi:DNA replication ATP-dependent helicase Dna2